MCLHLCLCLCVTSFELCLVKWHSIWPTNHPIDRSISIALKPLLSNQLRSSFAYFHQINVANNSHILSFLGIYLCCGVFSAPFSFVKGFLFSCFFTLFCFSLHGLRWEHWEIMIIGSTLKAANQSTLMNERRLKSSFTFNQVVKLPLLLLPLCVPLFVSCVFCCVLFHFSTFLFRLNAWVRIFFLRCLSCAWSSVYTHIHTQHTPNNWTILFHKQS